MLSLLNIYIYRGDAVRRLIVCPAKKKMPPLPKAAGPTSCHPFRSTSRARPKIRYVVPAAWSSGGRGCRLHMWRQVPRVSWRACRHGRGGLFCQLHSEGVFSGNFVGQVVLFNKKSLDFRAKTIADSPLGLEM